MKGMKIGVVFGERERESQRGTVYTITEAAEMISADDVRKNNYKVPEKKCLQKQTTYSAGFSAVEDDGDLPF